MSPEAAVDVGPEMQPADAFTRAEERFTRAIACIRLCPASGLSRLRYIVNGTASGVSRTGPITCGLWNPGSKWNPRPTASETKIPCPAIRHVRERHAFGAVGERPQRQPRGNRRLPSRPIRRSSSAR